jgi:beta-galactosidase
MNRNAIFFISLIFVTISILSSSFSGNKMEPVTERDLLFNNNWRFLRDSIAGAEQPAYDDSKWLVIDLPHDYSIMNLAGGDGPDQIGPFSKKSPGNGNSTGQVLGGTGWYRKSFTLGKASAGKTIILSFDGVYMESEVWVNGKKAGIHKNGYTPFWFDITSLLYEAGKTNLIAVRVDNTGRNSRWYSGSGIYRDVHLIITQPVHVAVWGVKITTPVIRQNSAVVDFAVTTTNEKDKEVKARITINIRDRKGIAAGTVKENILIPGGTDKTINKQIEVEKPLLWSPESPDLYTAEIIVEADRKVTDKFDQTFGIRSIEFSRGNGFRLNGKTVRLKGGCMHHDNGLLGSAAFERAEIRRVEIMKANGYNAIRCAHNPPSEVFLNACDRIGMLVIDEFTDMWETYKNPQDYSRFFREWWNKDLTDMILRDRNHPGIVMWSIGNEIFEKNDSTRLRIGRQLAERVRTLDNTRPVTQALTDFFYPDGWDLSAPAFAMLDVCGYNYCLKKYESDHQKYPERMIFASESFPVDAYDYWKAVEKNPYVIGDFVWTSMDYLGEVSIGSSSYVPGNQNKVTGIPAGFKLPKGVNIFDLQVKRPSSWPSFVAWCGDIDITGEKKPQMLYRDILWNNSKIEINVHEPIPDGFAENISMWGWPNEWPEWNWKGNDGKPLQVRVFTKASHVRLELNRKVIGEKDILPEDKYIAVFNVPYQPGELKAVAIENGKEIADKIIKTSGPVTGVRLVADRSVISSDRNDLAFITIEAVDQNGLVVTDAALKVKLTVTGNGELVASGNACPNDMESVNKSVIKMYRGKAQMIIRPFSKSGDITLKAESAGLKSGELTLQVKNGTDYLNNIQYIKI